MNQEPEYSISELARQAGVTPRTIRYYTSEGLLPQPETRGRYARYRAGHLQRLRQIAALKAQYLPLSVIRQQLDTAAGQEQNQPVRAAPTRSTDARSDTTTEGRGGHRPAPATLTLNAPTPPEAGSLSLGRYQFFPDLPEPLAEPGDAAAAADTWQRVVLAPGIELHVREPISAAQRERLLALIAAARDQLQAEN